MLNTMHHKLQLHTQYIYNYVYILQIYKNWGKFKHFGLLILYAVNFQMPNPGCHTSAGLHRYDMA